MKIIRKIKPNLSLGPDGIAPFAIKNLGQSIAYPLARFFRVVYVGWASAL